MFCQVFSLLERAKRNRSVAQTMMNVQSSRSHSVFRLYIEGKNSVTGKIFTKSSTIHTRRVLSHTLRGGFLISAAILIFLDWEEMLQL